ncbi:hypothetical protein GL4_1021 [Methyloceanibacter caenitepidi]|uniref:Uncharacterized protein n=1 Tax=Methyloceanibacter caenitepidi TaxID=1384459 RepID=A0A0A8K130_9HYPH|nr:hypothetical protein GL4_1021 [Methyloceanibacter caenitepidi]
MGDNEACVRFQTAPNFPQRPQSLAAVKKVERQEARCTVERTGRCSFDGALHEVDAIGKGYDSEPREVQHGARWVDAGKAPIRP